MGMFGSGSRFNQDQRFGGGYDPVSGSMSLSGSPPRQNFGVPDDLMAAYAQPRSDSRNKLFGDGSIGGIAGGIGKLLMYGPFAGVAQEGLNRRRQLEDSNMAYKSAMADHAGQIEDPPIIRTLRAAGIDPTSPQGVQIIRQSLTQPHFMLLGNAETGQQVIDANNPPMSGPPPEAVARLKANPAEAAQFDEIFGQGAAARAMGAQ